MLPCRDGRAGSPLSQTPRGLVSCHLLVRRVGNWRVPLYCSPLASTDTVLSTRSLLIASHGSGRGTWFVLDRGGSSGSLHGLHLAGMKFSAPYLAFSDTTWDRGGGGRGCLITACQTWKFTLYTWPCWWELGWGHSYFCSVGLE